MSNAEPKIVHLHIPKTAGTALRKAFERSRCDKNRIFPYYDERKYAGINVNDYDFFSGHIGYKTAAALGGEIVSLLRNPVDRFVSVYFFWRKLFERKVENSVNTRLAATYSLDDFVSIQEAPSLIEEFYNRMTFQIAYGSMLEQRRALREEGRSDDDIFRLAIANVQKFAVVGVQENISQFCNRVNTKFDIGIEIKKENVTEDRVATHDIPINTLRKIHDWVAMDLELFEFVRRIDC